MGLRKVQMDCEVLMQISVKEPRCNTYDTKDRKKGDARIIIELRLVLIGLREPLDNEYYGNGNCQGSLNCQT